MPITFLLKCKFPVQIFVANPNKKKEVLDILLKNKEKLIDFLTKFQSDRKGWYFLSSFALGSMKHVYTKT